MIIKFVTIDGALGLAVASSVLFPSFALPKPLSHLSVLVELSSEISIGAGVAMVGMMGGGRTEVML